MNKTEEILFPTYNMHELLEKCQFLKIVSEKWEFIENSENKNSDVELVGVIIDMFQFIIKFCALIEIKYISDHIDYDQKINEIIRKIYKNTCLGDWLEILESETLIKCISEELPSLCCVIKELKKLCKKSAIVTLRNNRAHGDTNWSMSFASKKQNDEIKSILEMFINFSNSTIKQQENIIIIEKDKLYVQIDNCLICMYPFILSTSDNAEKIFFFYDSVKNDKFKYLNHQGCTETIFLDESCKKELFKLKIRYQRKPFPQGKIDVPSREKRSAAYIISKLEEEVNKVNIMKDYIRNQDIERWFAKCLRRKKGIFLLEMGRGMGKTAFAVSVDQMLSSNPKGHANAVIRCYYCNKLQYREVRDFIEFCNKAFFEFPDSGDNFKPFQVPALTVCDTNPGQAMAKLLKYIKEQYKSVEGADLKSKKLVLLIDGVDEIVPPEVGGSINIFDYIPPVENLEDGVFIFLTCRSRGIRELESKEEEISAFVKQSLEQIVFTDCLEVRKEDLSHQDIICRFIKKYLNKSEDEVQQIARYVGYNFVELKLYANLIEKYNAYIPSDYNSEQLIDLYFEYLEAVYDKKTYYLISQIMSILVYAYRSLNVGEIRELCMNAEFDVSFIYILKELEPFIFYGRGARYTSLDINNIKYIENLKKRFRQEAIQLTRSWIQQVKKSHKGLQVEDYKREGKFYKNSDYSVQAYLHAYLYDYVMELDVDELKQEIMTNEFICCLVNYESYRNSLNYGEQGVRQDIRVCTAAIRLIEERRKQSLETDAMMHLKMYHDRAFLYNLLQEYHEIDKDYELINELAKEYGKTLKTDIEKQDFMALQARINNNFGSYEFQRDGNMEKAKEFFECGLSIRLDLMQRNFREYAEECLLSYVNLLSVCVKVQDIEEGKKIFYKGMKLAEEAITYVEKEFCKDTTKCLILNSSRKHRIEYGYVMLTALLKRKYGMLLAETDIEEAGKSICSALSDLETIYQEHPLVQIERVIIITYYELAVIHQTYIEKCLDEAIDKIEHFSRTGKMQKDSRYADVYYRRYLAEVLKEGGDKQQVQRLLETSGKYIEYLKDKEQERWTSHERHMYECVQTVLMAEPLADKNLI